MSALMPDLIDAPMAIKGRSLWDDARRRLLRNRAAVVSLGVLAVLVLAALIGPYILAPYGYAQINKNDVWDPPLTNGHLLGTDSLGRDLLARLLVGLRVSLAIGVVATAVSLVIGVAWGAAAGYIGGVVDEVMMRIVDVLYSLPFIFFVILLMVTFGRNFILIFVAIGAVEWLTLARIVRGQTLSLKQMEFIEAARAAGLSRRAIIARHIVPNLLGPVIVYATLTIPDVIMTESFLSFLGLGVQEPMTSLGALIANGGQDMELAPWLLILPSAVMVITLMAFNFIGDGLRDAIDPKGPLRGASCARPGRRRRCLLLPLTACGQTRHGRRCAPACPRGKVCLELGNDAEPVSLDPHKITGTWEDRVVGDMFVGLTQSGRERRADPRHGDLLADQPRRQGLDLPSARSEMVGRRPADRR